MDVTVGMYYRVLESKAAAIPLYLSILGGTCLGMGLVYAGTGREDGKLALLGILKRLQR